MYGCEIVCFAPIGSAPAPYAFAASSVGTNRCRGTSRIACRIRASLIPRPATYSCTMRARKCAKSGCGALSLRCVAKELLERFETRDRFVMGEVEVQRRDGDAAFLDRFEVGVLAGTPGRFAAADPVVRPAARIAPFEDVAGVDTIAEPRNPNAAELDGEVDVENDVRIAMMFERPSDQLLGKFGAAIEGKSFADERRERDRRHIEQRSFERGGDGAGVGDVIAEVRSEVDAGDDEGGTVVTHELEHGQVHAVGGRAVDDVFVFAELEHPQRTVQSQRMRRRALLAVRRDDRDLDATDAQTGVRQFSEPFAIDAVVIRDEDADHAPRMVAQLRRASGRGLESLEAAAARPFPRR